MVWGCFSGIGAGSLYRVEGILDSKKYIRLLNSAMFPSVEKLFQNGEYIYQQDNAPCHKAKRVEFFQRKGVSVIDWPAQSPRPQPHREFVDNSKTKGPQFEAIKFRCAVGNPKWCLGQH